jgi:chromosome segregation ATPase
MNFFGKKEDDLIDEKVRLTKLYLRQQREENSDLRKEYAELKELALRHTLMLDDELKSATSNDNLIKNLKQRLDVLQNTSKTNEETIARLEDEINQLKGVKSTCVPTDFQLISSQDPIQEILDKSIKNNEIICFRDNNGKIWQILSRNTVDYDEETSNIDEIAIKISLNP